MNNRNDISVLLACHKDPNGPNGRGGEISVRLIAEYLVGQGYAVRLWIRGRHTPGNLRTFMKKSDVVMTWGQAAPIAAMECIKTGKPYILMCRFWKNVAPLPAGDLMTRPVDLNFQRGNQWLFDNAFSITTNTHYSADVIKRWYGRDAIVSYVPIAGELETLPGGKHLTVITPEVYGEFELVAAVAPKMPDGRFLIVNCDEASARQFSSIGSNVLVTGYMDMRQVWEKTRILLLPIYNHDICGTRRVTIEAFRHSIPVIANQRCGVWEKIPEAMLVGREAQGREWTERIRQVEDNYRLYQKSAATVFLNYDTPGQLEVFEREILKAVKKRERA